MANPNDTFIATLQQRKDEIEQEYNKLSSEVRLLDELISLYRDGKHTPVKTHIHINGNPPRMAVDTMGYAEMTWKERIMSAMKVFGGEAQVEQIVSLLVSKLPQMDRDLINRRVTVECSDLARKSKILDSRKVNSKSRRFIYSISEKGKLALESNPN